MTRCWCRYQLHHLVGLFPAKDEVIRSMHDAMGRQALKEPHHPRHYLIAGAFGAGKRTAAHLLAALHLVTGALKPKPEKEWKKHAGKGKWCTVCGGAAGEKAPPVRAVWPMPLNSASMPQASQCEVCSGDLFVRPNNPALEAPIVEVEQA